MKPPKHMPRHCENCLHLVDCNPSMDMAVRWCERWEYYLRDIPRLTPGSGPRLRDKRKGKQEADDY